MRLADADVSGLLVFALAKVKPASPIPAAA
jgi:hypothetical protein